jgi:transposase
VKRLFVRKLTKRERDYIYGLIDDKRYGYRALITALSYEGYPVDMIARKLNLHPVNVRKWIRRFNKLGIEGLAPKKVGRKLKFEKWVEDEIVRIVLTKPEELGLHFSTWSLRKLGTYLEKKGITKISHTQIRRILKARGLKYRRGRLKLISEDPTYEAKKRRIQRLLTRPNCVVLFEDEKYIVAKQYVGYEWCFKPRIVKLNQRIKGKAVLFLALNPHKHLLFRKYFPNLRKESFYEFLRYISTQYQEDIYLILDNHPSHRSIPAKEIFSEGKVKPV